MTAPRSTLPEPPKVEVETLVETRLGDGGFLALRRLDLSIVRQGQPSSRVSYDVVHRRALDAAIVVAHHRDAGAVWIWLRSCIRPPVALRHEATREASSSAVLWEVVAGLIEPGESPRAAAVRELAEELGFHVHEDAMRGLGPTTFPAPAMVGERHHFFHVEVDAASRKDPEGDGSPLEAGAEFACVPLSEALAACRRGSLRDAKTELSLRRLADALGEDHP